MGSLIGFPICVMASVTLTNGKTLEEAVLYFRKRKEKTHFKNDEEKYGYFKIEEYTALLDEAFGITGYLIKYPDFRVDCLSEKQVISSTRCVIEILDENRNVCYQMEGWGSSEVTYSEKHMKFLGLNTLGTVTCTQGEKACCQVYGAFGCREQGTNRNTGSYTKPKTAEKSGGSNKRGTDEVVQKSFFVQKKIELLRTDQSGLPAYRVIGREITNPTTMEEKESEILVYPNQYKGCENRINEMVLWSNVNSVGKGARYEFKVKAVTEDKRNKEYSHSYVFKGFVS